MFRAIQREQFRLMPGGMNWSDGSIETEPVRSLRVADGKDSVNSDTERPV